MRILLGLGGALFLAAGLICMVWFLAGVIRQDLTSLAQLWGPLAIHAITAGLGIALLGKARGAKAAA